MARRVVASPLVPDLHPAPSGASPHCQGCISLLVRGLLTGHLQGSRPIIIGLVLSGWVSLR